MLMLLLIAAMLVSKIRLRILYCCWCCYCCYWVQLYVVCCYCWGCSCSWLWLKAVLPLTAVDFCERLCLMVRVSVADVNCCCCCCWCWVSLKPDATGCGWSALLMSVVADIADCCWKLMLRVVAEQCWCFVPVDCCWKVCCWMLLNVTTAAPCCHRLPGTAAGSACFKICCKICSE